MAFMETTITGFAPSFLIEVDDRFHGLNPITGGFS
jgi:hypothetical protein